MLTQGLPPGEQMEERESLITPLLSTVTHSALVPPPTDSTSVGQSVHSEESGTVWVTISEVEDKQLLCGTSCWVSNQGVGEQCLCPDVPAVW